MKQTKKKNLSTESYLFLFLLFVLAFLGVFARGFYSLNNVMSILNIYSYILISAIGMNLIILTGNIDVSAGALISVVCLVIAAIGKQGATFPLLLITAIVVGMLLAAFNVFFITKLKIPAIVTTLATTQIFQGALTLAVEGSIYDLPATYTWLAFKAKVFGIVPFSFVMCLIVLAVALLFMKYSRFSKKIYAIGNNKESARLTGINVDRTTFFTYLIAGALFGISGVIIGTAGQRVTTTMGTGLEMTFIASVVLGGTNTAGGSGRIQGTIIGALILAMISSAITYLGISSNWADFIKGAIILASVLVSAMRSIEKKRVISGKAGV